MTGPFATRIFRIVFALAGCYNLAFGIWAGFWPLDYFNIFGLAPPQYPAIWSCLGMVVGVYGFLYWYAAWKPERGRPIIAVGLLGKVLGPIGMAITLSDDWPRQLAMLNVYNDLIWWLPFALFLIRDTKLAERLVPSAPWACAVCHALGLVAMGLFLRQGMLTQPDAAVRAAYIDGHPVLWAIGWSLWMLCALSLVAFYAWWGSQLRKPTAATAAVLIAALGSVFDFSGESLSVLVLSGLASSASGASVLSQPGGFEWFERTITLLTAGVANALYTAGGVVLMWATPNLPAPVRIAMWATWIAGAVMTLSAAWNWVGGMMVATLVLFPLLIAWSVWMGRHWRPR